MSDIKNDEKKRKKPLFWIFMLFYTAIYIAALMWGISTLYEFLGVYENTLPTKTMDDFIGKLNADYYIETAKSQLEINTTEFENKDAVLSAVIDTLGKPQKFEYKKKSGEYTEEKPVYIVEADGKAFLKVTLEGDEQKAKFNFTNWRIALQEPLVSVEYKPKYNVAAVIPEYANLEINGIKVADSFYTGESDAGELKNVAEYVDNLPKMRDYEVDGLYEKPVVKAFANDGTELAYKIDENGKYCFDFENSQSLKDDYHDFVIGMEQAYISYMANENQAGHDNFYALGKYILSSAPIYRQIYDITVYNNNPYNSRNDKLISAENFRYYCDDCFSADMVFNVELVRYSFTKELQGNIRWYFVKIDGEWVAVDMKLQ